MKEKCKNNPAIKLVDNDENLFMLYSKHSLGNLEFNGLIFDKETGSLVCNNFDTMKKVSKITANDIGNQ